ncbi:MAG: methionyl-tRNA formyltransferase, partial [Chromatocurvus sp.]
VTIMQMDAGLDTGDMLATATCEIDEATTAGSLHDRLAELGAPLLLSVLEDLPAARSNAVQQNDADATYAAKIDKAEACIDWTLPASLVARRVRAFNPFPTAYTFIAGERIKVWRAHALDVEHSAAPGTLLETGEKTLHVACGTGALALDELQFPGGRALPAVELLKSRGALLAPGQRFTTTAV